MRIREIIRIDESNAIRVGKIIIRKLQSRLQLIKLLEKTPSLRGWITSEGEIWVWDAEALTHNFVTRLIPDTEKSIYFWHSTNAPNKEFEQNGGRSNVMNCGDFLFDLFSFKHDKFQQMQDLIQSNPTLRRIVTPQ